MIHLNLDLAALLNFNNTLRPKVEAALKDAAQALSAQAHAHLLEKVQADLHSTRQPYLDAVGFTQVNDFTWVINLDAKAMWIEEGMDEHSQLESLLRSPKAKIAKDGSKFLVVPFQHNKGKTSQTPAQTDLTNTIKKALKERKIPYGKIERDESGKAKTGLLHSFDLNKDPIKTHDGPGQGHGEIGGVRQGNTGIPFLNGVRIYQKAMGGGKVQRGIMTFRIASSKHKGSGKWIHPGLEPRQFFEETADWALEQWQKISKEIIEDIAD